MRVAVIGVGGVGGLVGGKLAAAGEEVMFVARGENLEALRTQGLLVDSISGTFKLNPPVSAAEHLVELGQVDVIIIATKAWQVAKVLPEIPLALSPDTLVVPIQNGIRTVWDTAESVGHKHLCVATLWCISYRVEPGHIRHIGVPPTLYLGSLGKGAFPGQNVSGLIDRLNHAGLVTQYVTDTNRILWEKLILVVGLSAVGAITQLPIGEFRSRLKSRTLLVELIREVIEIGHSWGVRMADDCESKTLEFIDNMPPGCTASMQRDMIARRPSEFEYVIGDALQAAKHRGIAVPALAWTHSRLAPLELEARGIDHRLSAPKGLKIPLPEPYF